ncbi:hypothetical protein ABC255_16335 [Neobacillus sp. 3P2-tot-E-2]|uniref:hypothetical protein n=1 Tax=Neobacillus sp. 3P2-tot-E-2 TaxID=3132212 RepID=UPI0039A3B230
MLFVKNIMEKAPDSYKSDLQETIYESLTKLLVPIDRVNTDEAISIKNLRIISCFTD